MVIDDEGNFFVIKSNKKDDERNLEMIEMHIASIYREFTDLNLHIKAGESNKQNALNSLEYLKQDLASLGNKIIKLYSIGFELTESEISEKYPNLTLFQKKEQ